MDKLSDLSRADGTTESRPVMIIDGCAYGPHEFESMCEAGCFSRKIASRGFRATHIEAWTWKLAHSRLASSPEIYLYKADMTWAAIPE